MGRRPHSHKLSYEQNRIKLWRQFLLVECNYLKKLRYTMVAFVQTQESIWLLPRTAGSLQKLLQTYGLCTRCVMPPKVPRWLTPYISSAAPCPRSHPGISKSSRRSFRIIIDFLGPLATLLLCTWAALFEQLLSLPPHSSSTGGGSQSCLCFALLGNTACFLKNLMQEYSSFINRIIEC